MAPWGARAIPPTSKSGCAVFDPEGNLVAQAAHIPVHLGAMPLSVAFRWLRRWNASELIPPVKLQRAGEVDDAVLD